MRYQSEALSALRIPSRSPGRQGPVRVLLVADCPSCRLTIRKADDTGDDSERIEVIRTTSAELAQHSPDSWDLVIGSGLPRSIPSRFAAPVRGGILSKLFRREKLSHSEREEQRVTRTVVLAEIQREIGIALSAIEMGDFDTIGEIAMRLKEDGAIYNFAKLSGLGAALYDTAPSRDITTARNIAQKLMTYMGKTIGSYGG